MSVCTVLVQETLPIQTLDQEGDKIQSHPISLPNLTLGGLCYNVVVTSAGVRVTEVSLCSVVLQANPTRSALAKRSEETQLN